MKNSVKFILVVLMTMVCSISYAQEYMSAPKSNEKVIGIVSVNDAYPLSKTGSRWMRSTKIGWYHELLEKAKQEYPGKIIDIRSMEVGKVCTACVDTYGTLYDGPAVGKVVELGGGPETQSVENLSKAMDKAFRNVREGSRVAIDMVTVSGGIKINREEFKDQIIDALLDKGYKVVAKDYLEKLYDEQQTQQSGIYNEKTTVQENNFSAVGYYVNVKVTETSLRVQVVNVSTGEYEGNATITF